MDQNKAKLITWIKIDGKGNTDPSNLIQLPVGKKPAKSAGRFVQIPTSICCDNQSFILFRNTTASADITSITTADGTINITTVIENGDYYIAEIPNSYNETFTITVDTPSSRTITTSTIQGDGTISAVGAITEVSNDFTTSATKGSQYLVILS